MVRLFQWYGEAQRKIADAKWIPVLESELLRQPRDEDLPMIERFMTQTPCHRVRTANILSGSNILGHCEGAGGSQAGYLDVNNFSTSYGQDIQHELRVYPVLASWVRNPNSNFGGDKDVRDAVRLFGVNRLLRLVARGNCILIARELSTTRTVWQGGASFRIFASAAAQSLACRGGDGKYRLFYSANLQRMR